MRFLWIVSVLAACRRSECDDGPSCASPTPIDGADADTDTDTDADTDTGGSTPTVTDTGPKSATTFFVTSTGSQPDGGDLGGLAGADSRCADLAAAVGGSDHTWRAYLSTTTEDARDRIGTGPWVNAAGVQVAPDVDTLHASPPVSGLLLDESAGPVPALQHDILTGSAPDGTAQYGGIYTCADWTSSEPTEAGQVGHTDHSGVSDPYDTWNSAHPAQCDPSGMSAARGVGRLYCFAAD